jgi:ACS family glucarate transporter-like MFS transporter
MESPAPTAGAIALPRPTRARHVVLMFLCALAFVLYLDRVCISQALVPMKAEFGMTNTQASVVLMAFTLAYGLFEIPTGRWGDRFGSRRVLTRIVLWWSAFTVLTGWVPIFEWDISPFPFAINGFALLVAVRFLFGAGEAGAIPNAARIIKQWFPNSERGVTQGLFQASMHVGGTVAPVVAAAIIEAAGWRWTFSIFGLVGVVWAALFYRWFRDSPADHPAVNQAEMQWIGAAPPGDRDKHGAVPWRDVMRHPNIWLLSAIITMTSFNSYFFFSWYSTYLQEARKVDNAQAGWLAALALGGAAVGSLLGGYLADLITRRAADRYRARRWLCLVGFIGAAACLLGSVHVDPPILSGLLCALACLLMFLQMPSWWAVTFDASGKHTGTLFGLLNGMGVIGAMASQYFFGAFADWRKAAGFEGRDQWDPAFYLPAALLLIAAVLWQFVHEQPAVGMIGSPSEESPLNDRSQSSSR